MVKRLTTALMVSALIFAITAVPAWPKKASIFDRTTKYSFRGIGEKPVADDDSKPSSIARSAFPTVNSRSLGATNLATTAAGPGITVEKTWEDWQYTVGRHRVDWKVTPDINFVYSNQRTSATGTDRYGYNVYSPTLGSWPQGLDVGCEVLAFGGQGKWPSIDLNGKGHIVLTGTDDAGGSLENHTYFQTSQFSCFWGAGTVIDPSQYTAGFYSGTNSLSNPSVEYQEWAGDTVVHLLAHESASGTNGTLVELVIQYFRKDGTNAAGTWTGPETLDSMSYRSQSGAQIASSPISPKVGVSYVHVSTVGEIIGAHGSGGPTDRGSVCWTDSEIFYRMSDSLGVSWGAPTNATQYNRTLTGSAAGGNPRHESYSFFDSQDGFHIVFNARGVPADVYVEPTVTDFFFCDFSNSIYHWSDRTDIVSRVSNADYGIDFNTEHCGFGGNGLGYGGMMSVGECDGNLYTVWSQIHDVFGIENNGVPLIDDCASGGSARGRNDMANQELWMSISSGLDGQLWDLQRNISKTYTPGCDSATVLNGAGICMSETKASLSRYGMDDIAMTATFGTLTWPGVARLDPSGSYTGDNYLQLFYLEDHWPGSSGDPSNTSAVAAEGELKWARLACIDPITAPQIAVAPTSAGYPDHTGHGAQADVVITVTNDGNTGLNISSIESIEDAGPTGWLATSVTSLTIPAGALNTATFDIQVNKNGLVNSPGSIVFLPGRVRIRSDAPAPFDVVDIEITYIVGPVADQTWDSVNTGAIQLTVASNGEIGNFGLGGANMDYTASALDCDLNQNVYVFDGSVVLAQKIDSAAGDFRLSANLFTQGFGPSYAFKPISGQTSPSHGTGPDGSDILNTGTFVNWDSSIAVEQTFYAPTSGAPNDDFIIMKSMFFSNDGQPHANLLIGDVFDWDSPSDDGALNLAGTVGNTVYLKGIDTAMTPGCQLFDNRYSASAFLGHFETSDLNPCANDRKAYGTYASINGGTNPAAAGAPNGAIDSALLWSEGGSLTGEWTPIDTAIDQRINQTYVFDYTLGASDTLVVYTALTTVLNGTESDLDANVKAACDWYAANLRNNCPVCSCCKGTTGNIDNDPMDIADIADLTFLIDNLFINFTAIPCKEEGNIDGSTDGVVDIADLTFLIDNLFINFTPTSDCQ